MKEPNEHWADRYTSIDDLLARLIEQVAQLTEAIAPGTTEEVHFFTYPKNGSKAALTAGKTVIDFEAGTVMSPAGEVSDLGTSLRMKQSDFCRSLYVTADQDIVIQIDNKDKIPVSGGLSFKATFLNFQRVKIITTAVTTNTFVLACTHPNAIDITGEVSIKDTTDVWGNSVPMGLGELAVRTHAPPMTFDRRGDVLRWADFERATPNYQVVADPHVVYNRSTDTAAIGEFSLKAAIPHLETVSVQLRTNDFHIARVGGQFQFSSDDTDLNVAIVLGQYTGSNYVRGKLGFNFDTGDLEYLDSSGSYQTIDTVVDYHSKFDFSTFRLVVDLSTGYYVRAIAFGSEYDLSAYPLRSSALATAKHLEMLSEAWMKAAGTGTIYIDNIIITGNEPE